MSNGKLKDAAKEALEKWLLDYRTQGKLIRREHDFEREFDNKIRDNERKRR